MSSKDETWNTCPDCGKKWKDPIPTLGLIHRTRLCADCFKKLTGKYETDDE